MAEASIKVDVDVRNIPEVKAEIERLTEVVRRVNAQCDHLGIRLGEVMRERDALLASGEHVAWIDNSGHPKHLSYIQGARERQLYGPLRPLYAAPPKREPYTEAQIDAALDAAKVPDLDGDRGSPDFHVE